MTGNIHLSPPLADKCLINIFYHTLPLPNRIILKAWSTYFSAKVTLRLAELLEGHLNEVGRILGYHHLIHGYRFYHH